MFDPRKILSVRSVRSQDDPRSSLTRSPDLLVGKRLGVCFKKLSGLKLAVASANELVLASSNFVLKI